MDFVELHWQLWTGLLKLQVWHLVEWIVEHGLMLRCERLKHIWVREKRIVWWQHLYRWICCCYQTVYLLIHNLLKLFFQKVDLL